MENCFKLLLIFSVLLLARPALEAQHISFSYSDVRLESALKDLQQRYGLRFSYSRDLMPLDQQVSATAHELPLSEALNELFATTQVVHAQIGTQIVLKTDPKKPVRSYGKINPPRKEESPEEQEALVIAPAPDTLPEPVSPLPPQMPQKPKTSTHGEGFAMQTPDLSFLDSLHVGRESHQRLAQVSFAPMLGSNGTASPNLVNNFSLNLLWGYNGGVEGVEFGGLGNTLLRDMRGVQVGGLGNTVGNNMTGTQVGGWFNYVGNDAQGFQLAGWTNYCEGNLYGMQLSGLFNYAGGSESNSTQVAGLANYSHGRTHTQVSGIFNRAHTVTGVQLGLINVADTVSGVSIGLLNFVRRGYNRLEIGGSESLFLQANLKFGSERFYNILQTGVRWTGGFDPVALDVLAAGYGIGTRNQFRPRWGVNHELVSMHLFEGGWEYVLNQLNQYRWSIDYRFDSRRTIFAGISLNALASQMQDTETGVRGSKLPPYTWLEDDVGRVHWQLWAGFTIGLRF